MSIHYFELNSRFAHGKETHDFWEMVYVDRGTALAVAGEKEIKITAGEVLFHPPGEHHALSSCPDDPPTVFVISFYATGPQTSFFKGLCMNVPTPLRRYITEMISDGQEAYVLDNDSPSAEGPIRKQDGIIGSEQLIKLNLEMFLVKLIRYSVLPKLDDETPEDIEPLAAEIMARLKNGVYGKVTVEGLAKSLGFSRTHIAYVFKRNFGKTVLEYITDLKISEAKYLIRKGQYSVAQIAEYLHFENPHYFYRVFKKATGLTPKEYSMSVSYPDQYAKKA
jgi:AraC-like DNA-binding protein